MPFDSSVPARPAPTTLGISSYDTPDPSFVDTLGAAFRQENLIGSTFSSAVSSMDNPTFFKVDPNYDIYDDLKGYEAHASRFEQAYNKQAGDAIKADIDKETKDRQTLQASGWTGVALSAGASIFDPTILIPGGALVRSGKVGYQVGKSALAIGAAAGAATALQEAGLQGTQQLRTPGESLTNIGGSAILGGIIGAGAAKFLSKGEWDRFGAALKDELDGTVPNPDELVNTIVTRAQSAGASAVDNIKLDDLGVGGPKIAEAVAKATAAARINPGIQTMLSPSVKVREAYAKLVDNPIYTKMNMEGQTLGADVENLVKQYQRGSLSQWIRSAGKHYKDARADGFKGTKAEFYEAVAYAGRRGDVDPNGNAFVTRAAEDARKQVFDPLLKNAIDAKLLPEDVRPETAATYVTRLWNREKLIGQEPEFRKIAAEYFDGALREAEFKSTEIKIGNKVVSSDIAGAKYDKIFQRLSDIEDRLAERASTRTDKMAATEKSRQLRFDVMKERAPKQLVDMLRGADETAAMVDAVKEARKGNRAASAKKSYAQKYPVLGLIRGKGGVRVGSKLDFELRAMDITPKSHPGLFRSDGGIGDVDNFVKSEDEFFADLPSDGADYVDPIAVMQAIRDEVGGNPLRTPDELADEAMLENIDRVASEWLDKVGLPENATVKEVREFISRVLGAEKDLGGLDTKVSKLESEIEDFDKATDALINERDITAQEAATIADEVNKLEEELAAVGDIANASPRVGIIVDYAKTKRDLFKAKLRERTLKTRVSAIDALKKAGRANDDMLSELAAKSVDLQRVSEKLGKLKAKADKLEPMVPKEKQEIPEFISDADRADYIEEIVTSVFDNLTGRGNGDVPEWIVPVKRGPLKDRTFKISDDKIEQFLRNDMELIMRRYARTMSAEVELTKKFGSADMKDTLSSIQKEYAQLRKAAKTDAARMKLDAAERRDITNMTAFRDMVRGTYRQAENGSAWSKATQAALTWNYMRLLGGVALSSLTDVSRTVGVHGLRATFREALPALVSNLRAAKISRQDARDLGAVTETILQSRLASLAELNDPYAYGSKFERFLSNSSHLFSKATGLSWLNDTTKTIASVMTQNRMMRNALVGDYAKLPAAEKAYMGYLGINEDMAQRIAQQFEKHGIKEQGIYGPNVSEWTDDVARRAWAAALNKDVDRTIITKGIADTPLWMKTNWGKLIMQFKSFGLASHQRVLIAGLQERPQRLLEQMAFGTAIGMMVGYLKYLERGDTDQADRLLNNPGLWISDGLDRTGILSLPFEVSNTAEKLGIPFGITTAAQKLAGDQDQGGTVSRYASRNKLGAVMGPSAGLFEDLATIAQQMAEGDMKKSGANAVIRQIPGASLPGVRTAIHVGVKPALVDMVE